MRSRDTGAVAAVRTALAAIDNAEAVPQDTSGSATPVVLAKGGDAEVERRKLDEDGMRAIVAAEADEYADLSRRSGELGATDAARVAFEQATLLRFLLDVAAGSGR